MALAGENFGLRVLQLHCLPPICATGVCGPINRGNPGETMVRELADWLSS
jgi:hypothetical protein